MEGEAKVTILPKEPVEGKAFAVIEKTTETKVCECCGIRKPLSEFNRQSKGYRKICKLCQKGEAGATEKFKAFTARELWEELKRRGYYGPIHKKVIETLD